MIAVNACVANASTNKIEITRNLSLPALLSPGQNREKAKSTIDIDKPARILIAKNSKKKTVNANVKMSPTNIAKNVLCLRHCNTDLLNFHEKIYSAAAKLVSDKNKSTDRNAS